jgi:hypothetical protein
MNAPLLFDELLDALRREGFSVGTDHYLRMHALFERGAAASPDELKTLLCPIFAMSAAEQGRFHVAYDEFFAARTVPRQTLSRRATVIGQTLPGTAKPGNPVRWRRIVAITMSVVAVVVAAMLLRPRAAPKARPPAAHGRVNARVDAPAVPLHPPATPPVPPRPEWLLIAGALTLALLAAEVGRTLLRWLRQRRHRAKGRPFDWPVRDPQPTAPRLFGDRRFFEITRLMKGREASDVRRLDVARSVLATSRALGDPVFEYKLDQRVTEYLFLVERYTERDHLASYVHAMIDALARDGVLVEVFEHDGDPRYCWKPGTTARVATVDLYARFPQHRLVIVGNAAALTNPVTGEALDSIPRLFPWNYRAILTPEEETRGGVRFAGYFEVYALAENGLARLAEGWQQSDGPAPRRRSKQRHRVVIDLPSSTDELERELDPLIFRWLLRCAVHPTLHWDLTRELAPPLPAAEHEKALLELARLAWFRQGRIPEPERLALVARLSDDEPEETAARTAAMRVLAAAPPPPPDSMAARVFEIQQLAHRIWGARDNPAELRTHMRKLRQYPPSQIARDGALMMLLREAPGTLVTHALPQPLRDFLFRNGIPAFGMKNFVALAVVLPVMLFGAESLRRPPEVKPPPPPKIAVVAIPVKPPEKPAPIIPAKVDVPVVDLQPAVAEQPHVEEPTSPPPIAPEKPAPPIPQPLPSLIAPAAGAVITIANPKDVVTFTWAPAGEYTLQVFDSRGMPVQVATVRGTTAVWRVSSASSAVTWSLKTSDGRTTESIPFRVEYNIELPTDPEPRMLRTIEVSIPVRCGMTEGKYDVRLGLTPRQTFESVQFKILNADAFELGELTPYDQASFAYRFNATKGCSDDTLAAKVRVTATILLKVP